MKTLERVVIALLDERAQTACWEKNWRTLKSELAAERAEVSRLRSECDALQVARDSLQRRVAEQQRPDLTQVLALVGRRIDEHGRYPGDPQHRPMYDEANAIYLEIKNLAK